MFSLDAAIINGDSTKALGHFGEQWATREFCRYTEAVTCLGDGGGTDLIVNGKRIDVKLSRRNKDGYYRACMKRVVNGVVKTDCARSDYALVILASPIGYAVFYLIPTNLIKVKTLSLSLFSPKWAAYRHFTMGDVYNALCGD